MNSKKIAADHLQRVKARMGAISYYMGVRAWPEVVRTSQEVVELGIKAALRGFGFVPPRTHEMSEALHAARSLLPDRLRGDLGRLADISKELYKDRTLALYGSDDVIPSEFYGRAQAEKAAKEAEFVFEWASRALGLRPDGAEHAPPLRS